MTVLSSDNIKRVSNAGQVLPLPSDMRRTIVIQRLARFGVIVLVAAGCSQSGDRPSIGAVTGTVTLDGQPLAGAWVIFYPDGGRCSGGITDELGKYELLYLDDVKGAKVGHHKVVISTLMQPVDSPDGVAKGERVPRNYNSLTSTTLEASVEPRSNIFDFPLESKKKDGK